MPGTTCFSYSADVPLGIRNRSTAQRRLRDIRSMPVAPCFSYSADVPLGISNRDAAQRTPREMPVIPVMPVMPGGHPFISYPGTNCFSYTTSSCFHY
jgi:hypothetical protein